jgi:transcriptional regulator with PAS, ATPase and Fis domain
MEHFGIVTVTPGLLEILETVEKLARSRSPVLILGESGTGKELIAEAIHKLSGRKGEYLAINCAALPRDVIESELFGHVSGAFTGATRDKPGLLEACEGGTAFLDEIGEMSLDLQSRLLRVMEAGEIRRVGATRTTRVTTRIVAATNREVTALRSGQSFRPDLYYRLAHGVIQLPPLRRRGSQDVELLARHFLAQACAEEKKRVTLSEMALRRLVSYGWPGNVRELKTAIVQRVVLAHDGHEITAEELLLEEGSVPVTLDEELEQTERRRIQEALRQTANSKADAARLLGIPRTTLINRIKRLGLE